MFTFAPVRVTDAKHAEHSPAKRLAATLAPYPRNQALSRASRTDGASFANKER